MSLRSQRNTLLSKYNKFTQSEFIRNFITLFSGAAIAQLFPLLISPFLSRLYTLQEFGQWHTIVAIITIFSGIVTLRYEMAVVLPKKEHDAINLIALSLLNALIISAIAAVFIFIFQGAIATLTGKPSIQPWLHLIAPTILFAGIYQTFNFWSTRLKTFKKNAAGRISQALAINGVSLTLGFFKTGSLGLILGNVAGLVVPAIVMSWSFFKKIAHYRSIISWNQMMVNRKKYRNFARINTPQAFTEALLDNGIVFIIILFFNATVLGQYSFAFRILKAPIGLIGTSIFNIFYERVTIANHQNESVLPLIKRLHLNLLAIGLPGFLLLFLFAPDIFAFVFSENYRSAGEIASIISPWLLAYFLYQPVSSLFITLNKQHIAFRITLIDLILRITALVAGGLTQNHHLTFWIMSLSCTALNLTAIYFLYRIAANPSQNAY